jgi:cysteine desulfurase family protein (TIGR01976 family)
MDHEGNISPWLAVAEDRGLTIRWLPFDQETMRIEVDDLLPLLNERTRLLALNYASNLTGSINDVQALVAIARDRGVLTYVDAVQYAPHRLVDVAAIGCDFLVCSSYKFFGPHLGVLWGRESVMQEMRPYKLRCASDDLPERFETGTPQTELLAGLAATADYLASLDEGADATGGDRRSAIQAGYAAATAHETRLVRQLIDGLTTCPGVTIHGIANPNRFDERVPTVSFTHQKRDSRDIAKGLAQAGVCVWSGHNYAYEVVRQLGINEKAGVVRIGIAHYNTVEEIDYTLEAVTRMLG